MNTEETLKRLKHKPTKKHTLKNPFDEDRVYLEIKYIQDKLDEFFPVRDEIVINEYVAGDSINITLRLVTEMGTRDGMGSAVVTLDRNGLPVGKRLITARKIARSMALKNAASSLGAAFGRDLNRDRETDAYNQKVVND